jgi:hypothetical protein
MTVRDIKVSSSTDDARFSRPKTGGL